MRQLWFKQRYVDPILTGEKTSTIRAKQPRFTEGDAVTFHVGPRPAFAIVRIVSIGQRRFASLDPTTQEGVGSIYGDCTTVWRIAFQLVA